jgi:uncharacterized protein
MSSDTSKQSEPDLEIKTTPLSGDRFAADLRGFGLAGIIAILVIILSGNVFAGNVVLPVGAILVFFRVRLSHTPWKEVGYLRPKSWIISLTIGLVFGVAFKFLMKAIMMPLLGADPINQSYHYLAGNSAMLPAAIWAMLVAGFGEETVFRGWMFERFGKLLGHSPWAKTLIIMLTSVLFGLGHYSDQGWFGVQQSMIFGLVFGAIYSATGRVFMLMVAHAAFDLTALATIYWNLEYNVAHFFFK